MIGLVNVIILARLLLPEDIGLVAMATLVISFASAFTEMGAQQLLIRQQQIGRGDIDAAWTIQLLQGALVSGLVLLSAPLASSYFGDSRLASLVQVLALVPLVRGFSNIGLTLARREFEFSLEFRALVYTRLMTFCITLILVLWLRSYWSLVLGTVIGALFAVAISYRMHPYRPRLNVSELGPYLRFARAIVPLRLARFGNGKAALIVGGGLADSGQFGLFNLAFDLTRMVRRELVLPMTQGLFPGYARLAHDPLLLARVFHEMLGAAAMLVFPMGVGLALVASDFVTVVLGPHWSGSAEYIRWFALAAAVGSISDMNSHILIVAGHEGRAARFDWMRLLVFLPVLVLAGQFAGLYGIAIANLCFVLCALPFSALVVTRSLQLGVREIALALYRPVCATLLMAVVVQSLAGQMTAGGALRLVSCVSLGALTYLAALAALWLLAGQPRGPEALLLKYLANLRGARTGAELNRQAGEDNL